MRSQYVNELQELKAELLEMGFYVEENIKNTVKALEENDRELAKSVMTDDAKIDEKERDIENRCLKLLLMQQPVASDMRVISSTLKVITDLERIGDFSADIAEITVCGEKNKTVVYTAEFIKEMGNAVVKMVHDALTAFANADRELAEKVCKDDDIVDDLFMSAKDVLLECIKKDEAFTERALDLIMVAKYLERIGDHTTNVAEWAIYSITGVHMNTEKGF